MNGRTPVGPIDAYETYNIISPTATHTRPATCAEVECPAWAHGWKTTVDTSSTLGVQQAKYITEKSGRTYTTNGVPDSGGGNPFLTFTFPAGQKCFAQHRVPLERQPIFRRRDGDHRGNPTGLILPFAKAEDWRDDMGEHLEKVEELRKRG